MSILEPRRLRSHPKLPLEAARPAGSRVLARKSVSQASRASEAFEFQFKFQFEFQLRIMNLGSML